MQLASYPSERAAGPGTPPKQRVVMGKRAIDRVVCTHGRSLALCLRATIVKQKILESNGGGTERWHDQNRARLKTYPCDVSLYIFDIQVFWDVCAAPSHVRRGSSIMSFP